MSKVTLSKEEHIQYVYKCIDTKTNQYYIGSSYCDKDTNPEEDGYYGSGPNWKDTSRLVKHILLKGFKTIEGRIVSENALINTFLSDPLCLNEGTTRPTYHNYGTVMSQEVKRKISEYQTGQVRSVETRKKMSEALKGRVMSDEWINKMANTLRGRTVPMEVRKKISDSIKGKNHPMYGKHHTEESKRKISESKKGKKHKPHSEETKRKIGKANSKPVIQMDKSGKFIKEWESRTKAESELSINNISQVCNDKRNHAGGYKWKYKDVE